MQAYNPTFSFTPREQKVLQKVLYSVHLTDIYDIYWTFKSVNIYRKHMINVKRDPTEYRDLLTL